MNKLPEPQDYLILPEWNWLDGVVTSHRIIRQFVATATTLEGETKAKEHGSSKVRVSSLTKGGAILPRPRQDRRSSVEWQAMD
jgi:hypothetical protein